MNRELIPSWNETEFDKWYDSYSLGHPSKSSVLGHIVRKMRQAQNDGYIDGLVKAKHFIIAELIDNLDTLERELAEAPIDYGDRKRVMENYLIKLFKRSDDKIQPLRRSRRQKV